MAIVGTYDTELHNAKLLILEEQAVAYEWILRYLENLNDMIGDEGSEITLDELLEAAYSQLDSEWGDYIVRGGAFEGYRLDMTFWDKYEILFERKVPDSERNSFFSCSC